MFKGFRRRILLARARVLIHKIDAFYDSYSCGMAVADHINPEGYRLRQQFNKIWARLRTIDPAAPEISKTSRLAI